MAQFVHLHNHTEYSLLDGMLRISENHKPSKFLKSLVEQGIPAIAMTDHGNMYGALDFYESARGAGIKPIVGCEFYITEGKYTEKDKSRTGHLTLLARNHEGYLNLMKLNSHAWVDGFYYHPRIDKELLAKHSGGLLCLSGCLKGFLSQYVREEGGFEKACALAKEYEDIFGKGNYYIELMDHGIREEVESIPLLKDVSKRTGIPVVATNDCHYEKKEDWEAHDVHVCISTGKTLNDPKRMQMSHELYFKSPEEMHALFSHTPEACANTLEIAEKCNLEFPKHGFILPKFDIPPEFSSSSEYFKDLCRKGLTQKMDGQVPEKYWKQLEYEFNVIITMGFDCYFLIVQDFINWARANGIPIGPGRGSGAGSLVAYSLDITRVDPIQNKLLFERFLNPDRVSMPDLDIDMSDAGRERVIDYVRGKYGHDKVSQIITFGTMKAKLALKDVARVMEVPVAEANRIAKMIPNDPKMTLEKALEIQELKNEIDKNPQSKKLFDMARKIEGLKRHTGIHAAGVLITKDAVSEYVPLARGARDAITTQFEGEPCSNLGLLKMDFLGLRTLTVIDNAEKMIRERHDPHFDINKIPLDDKKTYDMLSACKTLGIFQLESGGMRDLIKRLQPSQFSDLSALVALYRPGPMESGMMDMFVRRKSGQEKIEYETPLLEEPLKDTYGCMLYQEQIMEISKRLGGFTPGEADTLRKAMGKKKIDVMEKFGKQFVEGCKEQKIPEKTASHIYEQMKAFAGYGFNKSHSYAYALVSYQTAYLKANYPIEFMCSALTNEIGHNAIGADDKENKIVTYLEEARSMGFEILPPDVNASQPEFSVEEKDGKECIRFALEAIKNAGEEGCISIVEERKKGGTYKSLEDLCGRIDLFQANKKTIESLTKAGALDSMAPGQDPKITRANILANIDDAIDTAHLVAKEKEQNMGNLFGDDFSSVLSFKKKATATVRPLTMSELLNYEKEVLGLFFSGHPMEKYQSNLKQLNCTPIIDILEGRAEGRLSVLGIVTLFKKRQNKMKKEWAQMVIEDCTGSIMVNAFPKAYENMSHKLGPNAILNFMGNVRVDDESARIEINLQDVSNITDLIANRAKEFTVSLPADYTKNQLEKLKNYLEMTRGATAVYLEVPSKENPKKMHRIRTSKRIILHKSLLDFVENELGTSWSFK
ncbi:MAG: DNA polymerase III subunit alpha [Elusimicrobium sp.]|uniref:DNA polymerase III subunit alpha n=1 Tax=Candidatus Avelusimicrobium gallicola TaxID=2562704 RepID=A0A928HE43_9BACT|nr:DNA polymerase III subunit alpha [Elusimicrobium sp.]